MEGVLAVTRTSLLCKVLGAMALSDFPALVLFMASMTQRLGCRRAASQMLLTVTSLRSPLGTNFSVRTWMAGGGFGIICISDRGFGCVLGNRQAIFN